MFPIVSTEKSTQEITQNQADTVLHKTLVFACVRGTAAHALRFATEVAEASDALEAWRRCGWWKLGGHTSCRMVPPSDVCGFINPMKTSSLYLP